MKITKKKIITANSFPHSWLKCGQFWLLTGSHRSPWSDRCLSSADFHVEHGETLVLILSGTFLHPLVVKRKRQTVAVDSFPLAVTPDFKISLIWQEKLFRPSARLGRLEEAFNEVWGGEKLPSLYGPWFAAKLGVRSLCNQLLWGKRVSERNDILWTLAFACHKRHIP